MDLELCRAAVDLFADNKLEKSGVEDSIKVRSVRCSLAVYGTRNCAFGARETEKKPTLEMKQAYSVYASYSSMFCGSLFDRVK